MARIAKAYGAGSPLLLANKYGRVSDSFLSSLSADQKILIDSHLLNLLITAENEAQKEAIEKSKQDREHPGMERYQDPDDMWAEAERANREYAR